MSPIPPRVGPSVRRIARFHGGILELSVRSALLSINPSSPRPHGCSKYQVQRKKLRNQPSQIAGRGGSLWLAVAGQVCALVVLLLIVRESNAQITVRQTVELRRPGQMSWSSDGQHLAYVVKYADTAADKIRSHLYVHDASTGKTHILVSAERIGGVNWIHGGKALVYLAKSDTTARYQAWTIELKNKRIRQVTSHPSGVGAGAFDEDIEHQAVTSIFRVSPDSKWAVFYTRDRLEALRQLDELWDGDTLYTDAHMAIDLTWREYAWTNMPAASPTLWLVNLQTGRTREIWRSALNPREMGTRELWFDWSPDGKYIGLSWLDIRNPTSERSPLLLISSNNFAVTDLDLTLGQATGHHWGEDSKTIRFYSTGRISSENKARQYSWYSYSLDTRRVEQLPEDEVSDGKNAQSFDYPLASGAHALLRGCKKANSGRVACIREDTTHPPDIVSCGMEGIESGQGVTPITNLNPQLSSAKFGRVVPIRGADDSFDSGLIFPANYEAGKKYPLVVMQYNLYHPQVFSGSPSFTSYAPQTFAWLGFMVLLQNLPPDEPAYEDGDYGNAKNVEIDRVVGSLRSMIDRLSNDGLIDTRRMGIMGWSWGGFYTPYIQTHYPDWFIAAAAGDGGNHQPTFYWINNSQWRAMEDRFFGFGGPNGPHRDRWRETAPIYNVDRLRAPLLLEYSQGGWLGGIDLFREIRSHGGMAELHIYRSDGHVLDRPANRYTSATRHVDWFRFWLLGEEDSTAEKAAQYARWHQLRGAFERQSERSDISIEPRAAASE